MKILFFGFGSIGQRHARLLAEKYNHTLFAFRREASNKTNLPISELFNWEDVEKHKPDVAFITNPTSLHITSALRFADRGIKLFVEKPLGNSLEGLNELVQVIEKGSLVSYTAYNLRFHPVIQKIRDYLDRGTFLHMSVYCSSYLPLWRPKVNVRESYSARSSMGGGVILDLSHELDYTEYLLGKIGSISGDYSRRSSLTDDAEDWADMLLQCEKGPVNIHINFFSHMKQRVLRLDFTEFTLEADLIGGTIHEYKNETIANRFSFDCSGDFTYIKQLEYFFDNIDNHRMMNNVPEAAKLLHKIVEFKKDRMYHE
jgi:predicted dehydrogenase